VIEAETCCHTVTLNKINIHNTSCVLTCESLLLTCIRESVTKCGSAISCNFTSRYILDTSSIKSVLITAVKVRFLISLEMEITGPGGRAVNGVGLRPLACWDGGLEYRGGYFFCEQADPSSRGALPSVCH